MEFQHAEYGSRLSRVQRQLEETEIDALIVSEAEHIRYLTGYLPTAARHQYLVIPRQGAPLGVIRALDENVYLASTPIEKHIIFHDHQNVEKLLLDYVAENMPNVERLAVEGDSHFMTIETFEALKQHLRPHQSLKAAQPLIRKIRLRKSAAEHEKLSKSAQIADQMVLGCLAGMTTEWSTRDLGARAYEIGLKAGADNTRMVLADISTDSLFFHGTLTSQKIKADDIVHFEAVPQVQGYSARVMRPLTISEPKNWLEDLTDQIVEIQDEQIAAMVPGAVAEDVDRVCRELVLARGLKSVFPNATGYTLGLHGVPRTSDFTAAFLPGSRTLLEPGMVFHVYLSAAGIAISETVIITENLPMTLSRLPRRILVKDTLGVGAAD